MQKILIMKTVALIFVFGLIIWGCNENDDIQPTPEYNFNDSLIAYYPLNGNADDFSSNHKNLNKNQISATTDHNGRNANAMLFNGYNSFLENYPADENYFNPTNDFSLTVWIRLDNLQKDQTILSKLESGGYALRYCGVDKKKFNFACFVNGTFYEIYSETLVEMGKWYQLTGTFYQSNGKTQIGFYLNGYLQNRIDLPGLQSITSNTMPFVVGSDPDFFGYSNFLSGALDEIRIYNKALNQSEVSTLYKSEINNYLVNATLCEGESYEFGNQMLSEPGGYFHTFKDITGNDSTVSLFLSIQPKYTIDANITVCTGMDYHFGDTIINTAGTYTKKLQSYYGCDSTVTIHVIITEFDLNSGLLAYYPLNGNGNDASGNQKHLMNYDASPCQNHLGINSKAMSFNGTNSYLTTNGNDEDYFDPTGEISVCAWVKPANNVNYQAIICKEQSAGYGINFNHDFRKFYFTCNVNGGYSAAFSQNTPNINEWYFLVGTFSHGSTNSRIELYCNGVFQNMVEISGYAIVENSQAPLVLGGNPDNYGGVSSFFNGSMDEVRLYNRALSISEIQNLYNLEIGKHK